VKILFADPYITEEDVMAVAKCVREKRLSQGDYVQRFEDEFAKYLNVKHAVAVCNGTAALHTALVAIGVRPNDEIIVPSFSFISTANCALYQGAKPIFVDIDPSTYNIDPNKIEEKITDKTKAIIPVHYAGQPADMDPIHEIAQKYDLYVIEDAAEAHGALYKGKKAGNLAELACFSFYPNKNMTTGEGGMITTNDDELSEKMRMIRSHGQDERYHHVILGYNYRMTDMQAALGIVQLRRLDRVIKKKTAKAEYYDKRIKDIFGSEVKTPYVVPYATHVYMFYSVRFRSKEVREEVAAKLEEKNVETRVAFPPIHLQPLYKERFGYSRGYLPITEKVADTVLCLPVYSHITQKMQDYVLSAMKEAFN
jgi:dTDP-4-amino-4,6-dideoxygalactose transaminase